MAEKELIGDIVTDQLEQSRSSTKKGIMSLQLANFQYREWWQKQRDSVQPWASFLNTTKFKAPQNVSKIGSRVVKNVDKFQGNYVFVFLGLVVFSVLTSPLLLIAIAASLGACYIVNIKNAQAPLKVMGKEVSLAHQYGGVALLSFPVFWLVGAGGLIFWLIGASVFVIMLHAVMYNPEDPSEQFEELPEIKMETI